MGHRGTDNVNGFYAEPEKQYRGALYRLQYDSFARHPLVLYEEYEITSYDFGSSAQPLS